MAYTNNIPQPANNISTSQSQILGNFQFLADTTGNSATGFYNLPNGLGFKWGFVSATSSGTVTVTFATPFTTALYTVQLTRTRGNGNFPSDVDFDYWIDSGASQTSKTQFTIINNDGHTWGYYWFAVGV